MILKKLEIVIFYNLLSNLHCRLIKYKKIIEFHRHVKELKDLKNINMSHNLRNEIKTEIFTKVRQTTMSLK